MFIFFEHNSQIVNITTKKNIDTDEARELFINRYTEVNARNIPVRAADAWNIKVISLPFTGIPITDRLWKYAPLLSSRVNIFYPHLFHDLFLSLTDKTSQHQV